MDDENRIDFDLESLEVEIFETSRRSSDNAVEGASGFFWESCFIGNCCGEGPPEWGIATIQPCGHTVEGSCETVTSPCAPPPTAGCTIQPGGPTTFYSACGQDAGCDTFVCI